MNMAEWLLATAKVTPNAPALLKGSIVDADYLLFARRAAAIGSNLKSTHRLAPGDRVALFMSNRTEYLECLYGIWWLGAVAVPINAKLHGREAAWICSNSGAKLCFVSSEPAGVLANAAGELPTSMHVLNVDDQEFAELRRSDDAAETPMARELEDLAWLFYTSGTTGRPKGVMLSHGNLLAASLCYPSDVDQVTSEDCALYAAPLSHGAGLYNFIHVRQGARHCVPESGGFDPNEILTLSKQLRNISMFAAPTMVRRLADAAKRLQSDGDGIRTIVYGGGPMYLADIRDALATFGQRFVQIYGQGESPMTITALARRWHADSSSPRYLERLASVGTAHSAVSVRIADEKSRPLPLGEIGEVEVKGATVMLGYWNDPEATANTIRSGWLRTGDVGRLDAEGFLTLSDRSKDVIISGGSNIYPREIEEVLLTHPDVAEVAVIGVPDTEWGESVVACVVSSAAKAIDSAELDALCANAIARFKRPKRYVWLETLPKNNYGKVVKTALREMLSDRTKT